MPRTLLPAGYLFVAACAALALMQTSATLAP
jgi:hypothetical protein